MAGALRASPTSLTKLFSLIRGALPGPIAAKPTASAVGTGEARRSAAAERALKLAAAQASSEALREARRAVLLLAGLGLLCRASALGPHDTRKSWLFGLLGTHGDGLLEVLWTAMDRVRADSSEFWEVRDGDGGGSRRKGGRADGDG